MLVVHLSEDCNCSIVVAVAAAAKESGWCFQISEKSGWALKKGEIDK